MENFQTYSVKIDRRNYVFEIFGTNVEFLFTIFYTVIKNNQKKVEAFHRLICDLPTCNRLLLSWMIVHMAHVIDLVNMCIVMQN